MEWASASEIARAVADGERSALAVTEAALARIKRLNPKLNAFTDVTAERARAKARAGSGQGRGTTAWAARGRAVRGEEPIRYQRLADAGRLQINRAMQPPRRRDATLIERLEAAGAVLVGALNMGEYAYDFTGENVHDGPRAIRTILSRMTGGSSGGSGGAVAGGLVPLALGSDTNGSIRVPSSFCGIFGLKPTYGRLSRARTFPFVASFDHLGPFARTAHDLALAYDAMQGHDADDPVCAERPVEPALPALDRGIGACGSRLPAAISARARPLKREKRSSASPRRSTPGARSKSPKSSARARRPMSSPRPKARLCISTGCARAPRTSIPRCATA